MSDQKSTETPSTPPRDNLQTQTPMEQLKQALRSLEKVQTPLNDATEK